MNYPVWILLTALLGLVWALPTDKGTQPFQKLSTNPTSKPQLKLHPRPIPEPQPQQEYQEVVMYLTPSQIRQLQQTQQRHGMIISTVNPAENSSNEAFEQYSLKQQPNTFLEPKLLRQDSKDFEQYQTHQDVSALHQQILKEQSKQLKQKYQNQQEFGEKKQQLLKEDTRHSEHQFLKLQGSRELEQQLLNKQSRALGQEYINQQGSKELKQNLDQSFEQQYQKRIEANQYKQQLLRQRAKLLKELFIKEQEARELEQLLLNQQTSEPQVLNPYWYLPLQNLTEQKSKESYLSHKLLQKYVVPERSNNPYKTLAPQILLVAEQELKDEHLKPLVKKPQIQYVHSDDYRPLPPNELSQQLHTENLFIKPIQQRTREQLPLEFKDDRNIPQKFHLILYIPEQ